MAVTHSGVFVDTIKRALGTAQLALDLDLDTHKIALYSNTIAVDNTTFSIATPPAFGVAPFNANEVTGTNWATGGKVLANATLTDDSGALKWTADTVTQATATFTGARGALLYADALAGKNAICFVNFGADYSPSAGTFTIQWAATGIFSIDLTP